MVCGRIERRLVRWGLRALCRMSIESNLPIRHASSRSARGASSLPSEYLRDKRSMRFLTSVDADLDYRNTLAERATAVGDKFLEGDSPVLYSGVPIMPVPLFPENLGAGANQTSVLLCNPKNIHVGIWRNIRVESARDISEGALKIVATLRFDVKWAEEPAVAKAINVQLA